MAQEAQQIITSRHFIVRETVGHTLDRRLAGNLAKGQSLVPLFARLADCDLPLLAEPVLDRGQTVRRELRLTPAEGASHDLNLKLEPLISSGRIMGLVVTVENSAAVRQRSFRDRYAEPCSQMARLSRLLLEKFDQPMTDLRTRLGQILAAEIPGFARQDQERLQTELQAEASILRQLEGFILNPQLHDKNVNVQRTLGKAMDLAAMHFSPLQIVFDSAPALAPAWIVGHEVTLEQCFLHLLHNAAEAMPHGGRVTVSQRSDPASGFVHIDICDQGQGMSTEEIALASSPFYTSKRGGHLGIGLTISCAILLVHHGFLNLCATPGAGSTVTVSIPLKQDQIK